MNNVSLFVDVSANFKRINHLTNGGGSLSSNVSGYNKYLALFCANVASGHTGNHFNISGCGSSMLIQFECFGVAIGVALLTSNGTFNVSFTTGWVRTLTIWGID